MNFDHSLGVEPELWRARADGLGVHCHEGRESTRRDRSGLPVTTDACRGFRAPHQAGTTSAIPQAAASTPYVRSRLLQATILRQRCDLNFYVAPDQFLDPQRRIVWRCSSLQPAGEWERGAPPAAVPGVVLQPHESPTAGLRP